MSRGVRALPQSIRSGHGYGPRIAAGGLLLLVAVGLQGCKDATAKVEPPIPVRVAAVALEPLTETRQYVGIIRPRYESDLGFRVAGKIVERKVNVGDRVRVGDVIARLDATDFQLRLEAQQAEVAAARSSRDQAVASEERFRILKDKGHVSQAALDERTAAADEARSRLERAERSLAVERNQVTYTELRAHHDGVVSALLVETGQVVTTGQAVARVARLDELEAVVAIPEQKLAEVKSSRAVVSLWPETTNHYEAKLREVAPEADRSARSFEARFSVLAPDQEVQLGKTANVILERDEGTTVARVPLSAVMNDAKGPMVYVVAPSDDALERRAVAIHSFAQETAFIASGLRAGERVVTLGVHRLDEHSRVRIVETQSTAGLRTAVKR